MPDDKKSKATASEQEKSALTQRVTVAEGTMSAPFSNSCGCAILKLKADYPHATFNDTQRALTELQVSSLFNSDEKPTFTQEDWTDAVSYILARTSEASSALDNVTLYLPVTPPTTPATYEEKLYTFSLKDVLALTWAAINDDAAYKHNYNGSDSEKLQQAATDKLNRIRAFFHILESIKKGICHHGVRNELVMSLNETHKDVAVIEDPIAVVLTFMKEELQRLFWEKYNNPNQTPDDKKKLFQALITWMSNDNPSTILTILDPNNTIKNKIKDHFIQHAINPNILRFGQMSFDEYLASVSQTMAFDCDLKEYSELDNIRTILNIQERQTNSVQKKHAIETMQSFIQSLDFYLDNPIHKQHLKTFWTYHLVSERLHTYRNIFATTGELIPEVATQLQEACEAYFASISQESFKKAPEPPPLAFTNGMSALLKAVSDIEKNKMVTFVENFFANWFAVDGNEDEDAGVANQRSKLYSLLLDNHAQEIIKLDDDNISAWHRTAHVTAGSAALYITPYIINRFFLTAIISHPRDWSQMFAENFEIILKHVKTELNTGIGQDLSKHSYPPTLISQLEYLHATYKDQHAPVVTHTQEEAAAQQPTTTSRNSRPKNGIWMPQDVQSFQELKRIRSLLNNNTYADLFNKNKNIYFHILLNDTTVDNMDISNIFSREIQSLDDEFYDFIRANITEKLTVLDNNNVRVERAPGLSAKLQEILSYDGLILDIARYLNLLFKKHPHSINARVVDIIIQMSRQPNVNFLQLLQSLQNTPASTSVINAENLQLLINNNQYIERIANVLDELYRIGAVPSLVNEQNFYLITSNAQYAEKIFQALKQLREANCTINDQIFQLIVSDSQDAIWSANIILTLHYIHPSLVNEHNFQLLARNNAQDFSHIASALRILHEANATPSLANDQNCQLLSCNAQYVGDIARALNRLSSHNPTIPSLINQQSFNLLCDDPQNAMEIAENIKRDPGILTRSNAMNPHRFLSTTPKDDETDNKPPRLGSS